MKRFIVAFFCLLVLFSSECFFVNAAQPKTRVKLSFTTPQQGQQITAGKPLKCTGTLKCIPANTDVSKVYVWLFLVDVRQRQGFYYIQKPAAISKNGTWDATLTFRKNTTRAIAILTDASTNKLFKSWLAKGKTGKRNELPRTTQFLGWVDVKL